VNLPGGSLERVLVGGGHFGGCCTVANHNRGLSCNECLAFVLPD